MAAGTIRHVRLHHLLYIWLPVWLPSVAFCVQCSVAMHTRDKSLVLSLNLTILTISLASLLRCLKRRLK